MMNQDQQFLGGMNQPPQADINVNYTQYEEIPQMLNYGHTFTDTLVNNQSSNQNYNGWIQDYSSMGMTMGAPSFHLGNLLQSPQKSKTRKRVTTFAQRRAANIRERRRMFNLNEAFDELRTKVPTFNYEKRLSRIETLRLAIIYISFMGDLVKGKDPSKVDITSLKQKWDCAQDQILSNADLMDSHGYIDSDDSLPFDQ